LDKTSSKPERQTGTKHRWSRSPPDALALALLAALQGSLLLAQIHRGTRPIEVALDTVLDHIAKHHS
jgi:hypothetical protein